MVCNALSDAVLAWSFHVTCHWLILLPPAPPRSNSTASPRAHPLLPGRAMAERVEAQQKEEVVERARDFCTVSRFHCAHY